MSRQATGHVTTYSSDIGADILRDLKAFIEERWSAAQPTWFPLIDRWRWAPSGTTPEFTSDEAAYFLASVATESERPLFDFNVGDDRVWQSDRQPPRADGAPRVFHLFAQPDRGRPVVNLRIETIVHMAAAGRLQGEFGWSREQLIIESPALVRDGDVVLTNYALDILLLEKPCPTLTAKMPIDAVATRVGVEAKADPKSLDKLIGEMRVCLAGTGQHHTEHKKCLAIAELRPRFFLAVATPNIWRLFTVVERDGRAVLGDELPNLDDLHSRP